MSYPCATLRLVRRKTFPEMMNDNINSRYRQLEMPMRKENPVAAQRRKSERLICLTRHADDCLSSERQGALNAFCRARIIQMWRQASAFRSTEVEARVGREAVEAKCGGCEQGLLSR